MPQIKLKWNDVAKETEIITNLGLKCNEGHQVMGLKHLKGRSQSTTLSQTP